jgi:hypothetical protein
MPPLPPPAVPSDPSSSFLPSDPALILQNQLNRIMTEMNRLHELMEQYVDAVPAEASVAVGIAASVVAEEFSAVTDLLGTAPHATYEVLSDDERVEMDEEEL